MWLFVFFFSPDTVKTINCPSLYKQNRKTKNLLTIPRLRENDDNSEKERKTKMIKITLMLLCFFCLWLLHRSCYTSSYIVCMCASLLTFCVLLWGKKRKQNTLSIINQLISVCSLNIYLYNIVVLTVLEVKQNKNEKYIYSNYTQQSSRHTKKNMLNSFLFFYHI